MTPICHRVVGLVLTVATVAFAVRCESPTGVGEVEFRLDGGDPVMTMIDGLDVRLYAPDTVTTGSAFDIRVVVYNQTDHKKDGVP